MKLFNKIKYAALSAFIFIANAVNASAQYKEWTSQATTMTSSLKEIGTTVLNILSAILAIVAAIRLIPIFIKRGKNEGQTSELLTDWGFTLIFVLIGLQLIKILFL